MNISIAFNCLIFCLAMLSLSEASGDVRSAGVALRGPTLAGLGRCSRATAASKIALSPFSNATNDDDNSNDDANNSNLNFVTPTQSTKTLRCIPNLYLMLRKPSSFHLTAASKRLTHLASILSHLPTPPTTTATTLTRPRHRAFTMTNAVQEPAITSKTDLPITESRWLTLKRITYVNAIGDSRTWEVAERKTTAKGGVDAVAIGNILLSPPSTNNPPTPPPQTLLVIQYRPPLDAYTVEWPAGLIDKEETAKEAAEREFKEETGYAVSRVLSVSPVQAADPGMSNANMQLVMVEVDLPEAVEGGKLPEQRLDDGEIIERVVVPLAELYERLIEFSKKERFVVAAKLLHFAQGMEFMKGQKYF